MGFSDIVGLTALLLTIIFFIFSEYKRRNKKNITIFYNHIPVAYSLLSSIKVVIDDSDKAEHYKNLNLSTIVITNTGSMAIRSSDLLEKSIKITGGDNVHFRRVELIYSKKTISEKIFWDKESINISFNHLDVNDFIMYELLHEIDNDTDFIFRNYNNRQYDNILVHSESPKLKSNSIVSEGKIDLKKFILSSLPKYYVNLSWLLMLTIGIFFIGKYTYELIHEVFISRELNIDHVIFPSFFLIYLYMAKYIYKNFINGIFLMPSKAIREIKSRYGMIKPINS